MAPNACWRTHVLVIPTNRAAAVAPSAASSTPPWPRELAERKRAGRSTTGETTAWRREQRSSDGDGLAEPSILLPPVDGLAAPPRARRCVPARRGGAASARALVEGLAASSPALMLSRARPRQNCGANNNPVMNMKTPTTIAPPAWSHPNPCRPCYN